VPTLFPFQQEAVDHLRKPNAKGNRVPSRLVGDEMGCGKTVEALALDKEDRLAYYAEHGRPKAALKTLIIARPSALEDPWKDWILKFAPKARVVIINPKNRAAFIRALKDPTVHYYLMHWEAVRLITKELMAVNWFHIIADECHRIKNRNAKTTKALKAIKNVKYKTGLSGTPADDKPEDLWSVLNWLWPKYYSSFWRFVNHYCLYDEEKNWATGASYKKFVGIQNSDSLHQEMRPWFVRRLKKDVLKDLPEKYYSTIWVDLEPKQRRAYEEMKSDMIAWMDSQDQTQPLAAPAVVAQLCRLQQLALGYMEYNPETDKWQLTDPSTKVDAFMELINEAPDKQFIVFSQFKQAINMLCKRLQKEGITHVAFTGDLKQADRAQPVRDFQAGKIQVFASTIATGGESITLTSADTVVFLDRSWKPVQNAQAEDRAHRMGQKNAVQIIDIMARNTVDLGRKARIDQKWSFLKQILGDEPEVVQLQRAATHDAVAMFLGGGN
jgi:SNF2 family DNA or RNA helicase